MGGGRWLQRGGSGLELQWFWTDQGEWDTKVGDGRDEYERGMGRVIMTFACIVHWTTFCPVVK